MRKLQRQSWPRLKTDRVEELVTQKLTKNEEENGQNRENHSSESNRSRAEQRTEEGETSGEAESSKGNHVVTMIKYGEDDRNYSQDPECPPDLSPFVVLLFVSLLPVVVVTTDGRADDTSLRRNDGRLARYLEDGMLQFIFSAPNE
ncbi:hypothetical protein PRIPAC_94605 [Pristionchus pacificus]|uniref:Uncharacterized protein n=1 Tax=Pristionchus pacificus TaxID=54126 RepID=A0A2A6BQ24_PRIPA|nr:hypothetical protein PRIPAC_91648 [Pristionchus pacificus]KAF8359610.1 hypothetical protein PRIPAC_94605 [Pristionchus pacificus]|eukprot:PDM67848.1 hypothetical protein PRIPAC_45892 [Pristionchus pacificus]